MLFFPSFLLICLLNMFSHVQLFVTHQAPLSMTFSGQEYWSGLPFLHQGIFLTLGSRSHLLHLLRQVLYH